MDEDTLNGSSTVTSTGGGWFSSLLNAASNIGSAYLSADAAEAAAKAKQANSTSGFSLSPAILIGGGVVLLLVVVLAFRK